MYRKLPLVQMGKLRPSVGKKLALGYRSRARARAQVPDAPSRVQAMTLSC